MQKIIIFGATGNIGAYFTDYCWKHIDKTKYEVYAVGRKKTSFFDETGIKYIRVDLCDANSFEKLPKDDVCAIVHLAGVLPAYLKEDNPFTYIETNITGTLRILEYARLNHVDRIIYTQTWADLAGYWGKQETLTPTLPRKLIYQGDHAFYAITKSMIVDTLQYYYEEYQIKNFIFRLPNIYLYSPEKNYFVNGVSKPISYRLMIDKAIQGEDIEIWGNPNAFKDIIYIKDLCQMMYLALFTKMNGGIYNAGTGIKTTLREQIEGIIKVFSPSNHPSKIIARPEKDSFPSFVMDINNIKTDLGYEPQFTYEKYLEDYKKEMELKRFDRLWNK